MIDSDIETVRSFLNDASNNRRDPEYRPSPKRCVDAYLAFDRIASQIERMQREKNIDGLDAVWPKEGFDL